MSKGSPTFTFRWSKELRADLEQIAAAKGVVLADLVRQVLKDFSETEKQKAE